MKLARKLTVLVAMGAVAVLTFYGWLSARREIRLFETDMLRDHQALGRALAASAAAVWRADGIGSAKRLVGLASRSEDQLRARWIPLDEPSLEGPTSLTPDQRARLLRGQEVFQTRQPGSGPGTLYSYFPLPQVGSGRAALEISESLSVRDGYLKMSIAHTAMTAVAIAGVAFLVTAIAGVSLVGKPVRELVQQARRIGAGDFGRFASPSRSDELGDLAREMSSMCDRLDQAQRELAAETAARIAALEQLRYADRLMTLGKLASGVAHELGTPLNVVSARAKLIARGQVASDGVTENARIISEQAERMANIISQLLDFARQRGPDRAPTNVRGLVSQTLGFLGPLAHKRSMAFKLEGPEELPEVMIDPSQIQQVLTNLVVNAMHSMHDAGTVTVELGLGLQRARWEFGAPCREYLRMTVADQGTGVDPAIKDRIFEPFFTTKDVGEGTGLGLSVAYGIVREHGGFIEVESSPGAGSRFSVYLPA